MTAKGLTTEERFWNYVDKKGSDDCWPWRGSTQPGGYGNFCVKATHPNHRMIGAHRYSYELAKGEIPSGKNVLHRCDNRICVNPAHLYAGSQSQNMEDMVMRGRACFDADGQPRLRWEQVEAIRRMHSEGQSINRLARLVGVSHPTIRKIVRGETYKAA